MTQKMKNFSMKLSKTHKAHFEAARAVAELSDFPKVKVGCVAVYKHHIISSGFNSQKTEPLQKQYNICRFSEDTIHSVHSELACLKPLIGRRDINFKYVDLYVYRAGSNNSALLARPCPSCMKLIKDLGIRNIYFTTYDGYSHENILE